jgi:hypothetical protein
MKKTTRDESEGLPSDRQTTLFDLEFVVPTDASETDCLCETRRTDNAVSERASKFS